MANAESILNSIKKVLGLDADYDVFDSDIVMHINSVFFTLTQLGVGPSEGYIISGQDEVWSEYVNDKRLNAVKSYMYLRVRLLFDPPATSFAIESIKNQIQEYEWRLNVQVDTKEVPDGAQ